MKLNLKKVVITAVAVCGGVAFAHHIPVPLSYLLGGEILSNIVYHTSTGQVGVPPYVLSGDEIEKPVALTDGASFHVKDQQGHVDTVVFHASAFKDITKATIEEIVAALAPQLTIATAFEENGYLVLRGLSGGQSSSIETKDLVGTPVEALLLPTLAVHGNDRLPLQLSIPTGGPDFHGQPFVLVGSQTEGLTDIGGKKLPFALDSTTVLIQRAIANGALPSFQGNLDATSDAVAMLDTSLLKVIAQGQPTSHLYLAYVVFSSDFSKIDFVSNRLTIDITP